MIQDFLCRSQGGGLGSNPISSTLFQWTSRLRRGNNRFVPAAEGSVCLIGTGNRRE